jgi:bifunctional oligoribonuclease and PAP phosphatase NrnA
MHNSNTTLSDIASQLRAARRIGLVSHVRPDGDALGSLLGLAQSLALAGKDVIALNQDGVPWHLAFMPGSETIVRPDLANPEVLDIDLAVVLDTATQERMGDACAKALSAAQTMIVIDHHDTNPGYGQLNYIDNNAPAVGEIVFDLLSTQGFPMDDGVRQNLFVAISTDTGSFRYSSTTAHTHEVVAAMMKQGLDTARLATLLYSQNPMRRVELQRTMLNEMTFRADGRIASWLYTQATRQRIGVLPGDTEGLIDVLLHRRGSPRWQHPGVLALKIYRRGCLPRLCPIWRWRSPHGRWRHHVRTLGPSRIPLPASPRE